jgi:hypothetical protein
MAQNQGEPKRQPETIEFKGQTYRLCRCRIDFGGNRNRKP